MKIIDKRRFGPMLLMVSLAVVGSVIMLMMATSSQDTVSAQDCIPADSPFANVPGAVICSDEEPTATPTQTSDCLPADSPFASVPGAVICPDLDATATAVAAAMTATAASMEATAQARQTATAAAMTATAVADAAATAQAIADMTATAVADAAATAQAIADMTATAQAKRTATAAARMTRTAIAQRTVTAGGAPPPAPRSTATPVMIEKADVTAAEGASTVEPDMAVELMAGNITVKLPTLSRARTYQAMLSESDDCGDMSMACAMIAFYNAEGEMESDVRLISAAEIEVTLSAEAISELGAGLDGRAVAQQANALGGIQLKLMDAQSGEWNMIPSNFMVNADGSATVTAMTRGFSVISLMVYADKVEMARMQLSMALGTPTATPIPTATPVPPATPTAVPTSTPVPTPEPIIVEVQAPDTGDTSMPFLMLLAMAVFASMLALVGTKLILARVRR